MFCVDVFKISAVSAFGLQLKVNESDREADRQEKNSRNIVAAVNVAG